VVKSLDKIAEGEERASLMYESKRSEALEELINSGATDSEV